MSETTYLVTDGAGFIGSALVRALIEEQAGDVVNIDKLTYAGNLDSVAPVAGDPRYHFEQADICDATAIRLIFDEHRPTHMTFIREWDGPFIVPIPSPEVLP
jgi:dTDP-glucose 4,6-dehydratase